MKTLKTLAIPAMLMSAIVLPVTAFAQTAAGSPVAEAPPPAKEPVLQLNTFEVRSERDYGYRATNSITATRVGSAIADTPINIAVLTDQFITDLGAIELREVISRVAGVTTS